MAAAVAGKLHAAVIALRSNNKADIVLSRNGITPSVRQHELDGFSLKVQAGSGSLLASQLAVLDLIALSVFHKAAAQREEDKGDIVFPPLVMKRLDPFIMTGACSVTVLAVSYD